MNKELLMSSNYWVLNKSIVKELGLDTAFILINMVEADGMMADDNGWFYQTSDTLESITGMSEYIQTKSIKKLIKLGILCQCNRGLPMKRYFRIDYEAIKTIVFKKVESNHPKNLEDTIVETPKNKESSYKESSYKDKHLSNELNDSFEIFWKQYNKKKAKKKCLAKWKRILPKDRVKIFDVLPSYLKMESDIKFRPHPLTFLNGELWNDEIIVENKLGQNGKPFEKPKTKCIVGFERGKAIYEK